MEEVRLLIGIEATYFHKMSVSRLQDVTDEWGGTKQDYAAVPSLQLITCGYSQSNRSYNTTQTATVNAVEYNPKVFCSPSLDIRAGDRITVNYGNKVLGVFKAGEPYVYDSHQEVALQKNSEA